MKPTLALVVGLALGFGAAAAFFGLRSASERESLDHGDDRGRLAVPRGQDGALVVTEPTATDEAARAPVASDSNGDAADELFSPTLRKYARDGITRGWSSVRSQPIPDDRLERGWRDFRTEVLALPERIGREMGDEADDADALVAALATTDVFGLLQQMHDDEVGPFLDIVGDAKRFDAFLACKSTVSGEVIDGATIVGYSKTPVPDGAELRFGAGVYDVRLSLVNERKHFPRCLTLRGAGMDRTLLVWDTLGTNDVVERIEISDLTLFGDRVFDLRTKPSTVVLDRVRVAGFDCGAGGSSAFDSNAGAYLVRDSRIEVGYGRSPNYGALFNGSTSALLARFENCVLSGVAIPSHELRDRATVVFERCTFPNTLEKESFFAGPPDGVVLNGCSFTLAARNEQNWPVLEKHDLDDLFPNWRNAIRR